MTQESELLRRRYEREQLARKQAEQIVEDISRELYIKGQELTAALTSERTALQDTEVLLRSLKQLSASLHVHHAVTILRTLLNEVVPSTRISVYLKNGELFELSNGDVICPPAAAGEGINCNAARQMLKMVSFPVVIGDMGADSIPALLGVQPNTLSILLLAMNNRGKTTAYVLLENDQPDAYKQSRAKLAQALVDEAGIAMENARLFQEVERLSTTDPLTGLYNRRYFESAGEREISLANRHQTPLMMLMLDIDHFKLVNDTYGHGTGDIVLAEVAENCRRLLRTTDLNVRLGGEEFGFLCPNTSADGALTLGERIRKTIEEYTFDAQNTKLHTTVSIGVAGFSHGVDKMLDLIRKSDQALYQAKSNGRNRTQLWDNGIK